MITKFQGDNRWLSNFHEKTVEWRSHRFQNRESAYQWAKVELSEDAMVTIRRRLYFTTSGREAKKLSKELKAFTRPDWKQVNLGFMVEITHAHFVQNKDEREKLMMTYPQELIEGNNWHDMFWGVCDGTCLHPHPPGGQNWLGRILMAERVFWMDLSHNPSLYVNDRLVPAFEESLKRSHVKE